MPVAVIEMTEGVDPEIMQEFASEVVTGMREVIYRTAKHRSGRLEESLRAIVYGRTIVVESSEPYAEVLNKGTHWSRVMWDLIGKVIPIKLDDGRIIFRKATLDSVLRGKWRTKPRTGTEFVRKGAEIARSRMSARAFLNFSVRAV
jgi:hypothetical protein